jgi:Fe-S-cluster containining protein
MTKELGLKQCSFGHITLGLANHPFKPIFKGIRFTDMLCFPYVFPLRVSQLTIRAFLQPEIPLGRYFQVLMGARCPCGSGIKYKKCCLDTGKQFYSIGKNYQDKEIIFDKERDKKYSDMILDFQNNKLHTIRNESEALKALEELYQVFDEFMETFSTYAPCKIGCNTCCNLIVEISPIEAELIRQYVLLYFDKEQLRSMQERTSSNYSSYLEYRKVHGSSMNEYLKYNIPCSFLSNEGVCTIYKVRPFNCRNHIVFREPSNCGYGKTEVKYSSTLFGGIMYQIGRLSGVLLNTNAVFCEHISYWFKEDFQKNCLELNIKNNVN